MSDFHCEHDHLAPFFNKFRLYGPWSDKFHLNVNHFSEADSGDEFHDHPFAFTSMIAFGGYVEEILDLSTGLVTTKTRNPGESFLVEANHIHRIARLLSNECWTIFLPEEKTQDVRFYRTMANKGKTMIQYRHQSSNEWMTSIVGTS